MWFTVLIFGLSLFSGIWLWLGLSYISTQIGFHDLASVNPSDLGVMAASISAPILIAILIMLIAYNHLYIRNLFNNQQSFIKLLQRKLDLTERIKGQNLNLLMLERIDQAANVLLCRMASVITATGVLSSDEIQKLWQLYRNGDKDAFLAAALDSRNAATISARIEAKIIQDDAFAMEVADICGCYDDIYGLLMKYDAEQLVIRHIAGSRMAKFCRLLASYKKTEEKLIERRLPPLDERELPAASEPETEPEAIDWGLERNELIDKYRNFANTVKHNISKGALDED